MQKTIVDLCKTKNRSGGGHKAHSPRSTWVAIFELRKYITERSVFKINKRGLD